MTVLDYIEWFISHNNLGTSEGVSWEALEVCYVKWKEETQENLRVWLPCPIIKEFGGIHVCFFCLFVFYNHSLKSALVVELKLPFLHIPVCVEWSKLHLIFKQNKRRKQFCTKCICSETLDIKSRLFMLGTFTESRCSTRG